MIVFVLFFQGIIECDSETAFELAAHVLQATHGDYTEWVQYWKSSSLTQSFLQNATRSDFIFPRKSSYEKYVWPS